MKGNVSTLKVALYNTIHRSEKSVEEIAEDIDMAPSYLYRSALPDRDQDENASTGVRFPLKKIIPLVRSTDDYQVLDYIEHSLGRVAFQVPSSLLTIKSMQEDALRAAAEFGDLMRRISDSCEDGKLTAQEREDVHREGYEAITAIMRIVVGCEGGK